MVVKVLAHLLWFIVIVAISVVEFEVVVIVSVINIVIVATFAECLKSSNEQYKKKVK